MITDLLAMSVINPLASDQPLPLPPTPPSLLPALTPASMPALTPASDGFTPPAVRGAGKDKSVREREKEGMAKGKHGIMMRHTDFLTRNGLQVVGSHKERMEN